MGQHESKRHPSLPVTPNPKSSMVPARAGHHMANPVKKYDLSKLAVIAIVFNPVQYNSRYEHYHRFSEHMTKSGVNLITVECIFESAPRFGLLEQRFHVTRTNNPNHIQIVAPSIIWMKENLINIAVQRLPPMIEYIAWIDADIEFDNLNWPHLTIAELQRYPIVQLFELSFFLGPNGKTEILRQDYSFGYSIRHQKPIDPGRYDQWYPHPGYAWAMRRSAFNEIGGLIDFCIIGSGDLHFAFALLGRIEETIPTNLHQDYKNSAKQWGIKLGSVADYGRNVGYVPVNIWHFWHGSRGSRSYVDRWDILVKHQFSPTQYLVKQRPEGLIRIAAPTTIQNPDLRSRIVALERDIVDYFKSRKEDSQQRNSHLPVKPTAPTKKHSTQVPRVPHKQFGARPGKSGNVHVNYWSSGPSGTHVDDCDPYNSEHHCSCPGHHHDPNNPNCSCYQDCVHHGHDHHDYEHHGEGHHDYVHQDHGHHDYGHHGHDHHDYGHHGHDHHDYGHQDHGHHDYGGHGSFY